MKKPYPSSEPGLIPENPRIHRSRALRDTDRAHQKDLAVGVDRRISNIRQNHGVAVVIDLDPMQVDRNLVAIGVGWGDDAIRPIYAQCLAEEIIGD